MVKRSWIILVVIVFLLSACSPAAHSPIQVVSMPTSAPAAPSALDSKSQAPGFAGSSENAVNTSTTSAADVQRLVIMNASLSIVVPDPAVTLDFITNLAKTMQGYVVTSNLYKTTSDSGVELPAANITLRVPADKLNDALTQIKAQVKNPATDIRSSTVSGQDVTKEYTDLQSQLANLQQAAKQLQNIMDSATKTEDVLNVFNQLTQIQSQIEVLQGQIKYYEESAALSAITVDIMAEASVKPLTIAGWQPVGVARNAVQTLINALQGIANVSIWGVLFCLPIFIVIAIPVYIVWRIFRRVRKNRRTGPQMPTATPPAAVG